MRGTYIVVLGLALAFAVAVSTYAARAGGRSDRGGGVHELGWTSISLAMLALLAALTLGRG
jgi:hypothetical protein